MKILERMTKFTTLSNEVLLAQAKKWEALEEKLGGFPKTRRYRAWFSKEATSTYVYEREWDSLAAYEEAILKQVQSPEGQKLMAEEHELDPGPVHREIFYTIGE